MGLEFLGNPYENENESISDFEIERDEEWVVPLDVNLLANRQNLVPAAYWSLSDEDSDLSNLEDDPNDVDFNPDEIWEEEDDDDHFDDNEVDSGDSDADIDEAEDLDDDGQDENFQNPDDEHYTEYDEIEDVFTEHEPGAYFGVDDDTDFDEDDIDYVTFPITTTKPAETEEVSATKTDTNSNPNQLPDSTENSNTIVTLEPHDD